MLDFFEVLAFVVPGARVCFLIFFKLFAFAAVELAGVDVAVTGVFKFFFLARREGTVVLVVFSLMFAVTTLTELVFLTFLPLWTVLSSGSSARNALSRPLVAECLWAVSL